MNSDPNNDDPDQCEPLDWDNEDLMNDADEECWPDSDEIIDESEK